jgi:hypothetical protein
MAEAFAAMSCNIAMRHSLAPNASAWAKPSTFPVLVTPSAPVWCGVFPAFARAAAFAFVRQLATMLSAHPENAVAVACAVRLYGRTPCPVSLLYAAPLPLASALASVVALNPSTSLPGQPDRPWHSALAPTLLDARERRRHHPFRMIAPGQSSNA